MDKKTQTAGETATQEIKSPWIQELKEILTPFLEKMDVDQHLGHGIYIVAADEETSDAIMLIGGGSSPLAQCAKQILTHPSSANHLANGAKLLAVEQITGEGNGAIVINVNADQEDEADEDQKPQANGETEQPAMD